MEEIDHSTETFCPAFAFVYKVVRAMEFGPTLRGSFMKRFVPVAAALLCGGALLTSPLLAQTDAPPPPPQSDMQGPPPPSQAGRGHMPSPEQRLQHLQHALNLTPDQTTQVKALLEAERGKAEAARANTALAPEDRRSQLMANRQDTTAKIRALLTPDQATKFDAMETRMREHRQGPPPDAPAGAPGNGGPGQQ